MKRFRFPLRPVAVLRAHLEIRAREAFAAAVHACVQSEQELAEIRSRVAGLESALSAGRRERFSAAEEAGSLAAYRRDCAVEAQAERHLATQRATLQERRTEYLEAHRRVEVVSRLEEKSRAGHRLANDREEQAEFDDFAGRRFAARRPLLSP